MGLLADALVNRGHRVTWWASTFSHQRKALLSASRRGVQRQLRFTLRAARLGS